MKTQSADTSPLIETLQINYIKEYSVQQRLSRFFHLSILTKNLSLRAITRKNPGMNKPDIDLLFIKLNYGEDLYNKVRHLYL